MLHPDFSELEEEFGEVIGFLNEGRPEAPTERPSEATWSAIADALTVDESRSPALEQLTGEKGTDAVADGLLAVPFGNGSGTVGSSAHSDERSTVRPFDSKRASAKRSSSLIGKRFAIITAVAAAILLVAVPLSLAIRGGDSLDRRAELVALGDVDGAGVAELTDRTLAVDLEGLEPLVDADYELWLLDLEGDDLQDLVSLGTVNEDGSYDVPADLDLSEFSVVDVSIEPNDGNEAHSGNSVLRGPLTEG